MPTKKELNKFIDNNRPIIDEYLKHVDEYSLISLKGKLAGIIGKQEAFKLFEQIIKLPASEQCNIIRQKLKEVEK